MTRHMPSLGSIVYVIQGPMIKRYIVSLVLDKMFSVGGVEYTSDSYGKLWFTNKALAKRALHNRYPGKHIKRVDIDTWVIKEGD